ncbi:MAG: hypothetical protein AB7G76_05650 [Steroidobacteraceae bacterium]
MLSLILLAGLPYGLIALGVDRAIVDRVPIELRRYHSATPPADLLAHWPFDEAPPQARPASGGWLVASRVRGHWHEAVQARPDGTGGSEVLWSRVDLRAPLAPSEALPFAMPAGAVVLRAVGVIGTAGRGTQFIVSLPGRPGHALPLLCARLAERGWRLVGAADCRIASSPAARWFVRGDETVAVDMRAAGAGSRAVIGLLVPRP